MLVYLYVMPVALYRPRRVELISSWCSSLKRLREKIRELMAMLSKAGFEDRGGKGGHRNLLHPKGMRVTLSGNRIGQFSIRINQQWRICFRWEAGDAYDVEIVNYH